MKVHDAARAGNPVTGDGGVRAQRFEALYTAHYHLIAGYVLRRVAAHEADDVIAQIFMVAWRRFDHVPAPPDDRPWLFGVARNSVADQRRSERRRHLLRARLAWDVMNDGSLALPAEPSGEPVRAAMNALRPADREALELVLWDELSHAEAASVLGCSTNAFELRYRRARAAIREAVLAMQMPALMDREHPVPVQKSRPAPT